jgi:putative nucleotidyltransferase with HDIG domain
MAPQVDVAQVKRAVSNSIPLTVKTYTLPHETEAYIDQILEVFLKETGYENIVTPISYCVKELAVNAKKANTKRVYFKEKDLDLNNPSDYEIGMKTFKVETLNNIDHFLEIQKADGLYVKLVLRTKSGTLTISVHNNVEITRKEQMRVFDRIARSRAFDSMEEAFAAVLDNSEGAGLGIVILILMLKKIGLDEEAFELEFENGETIARIVIPLDQVRLEKVQLLAEAVVKEVQGLPQFPENLVYLQKLIGDPDADIHEIARQVSTDPSLTADLLKQVNSALYMLPKKIDNIVEAVKLVGMRGLRNLLYRYGSQKILERKYSEMRELWRHSYQVAYYAYHLARRTRRRNDVLDDAYVGGILHDLGKIVANALHPDLLDRIKKFCADKDIPDKLLEDFSIGVNHAEIGAMIATNWNFPEQLVAAIRWHHEPGQAEEQHREVVSIVYLADCFSNLDHGMLEFDQVEPGILARFGLKSEAQVRALIDELKANFDKELLQGAS